MPIAAAAHSQSLSSSGCGAWSVATASIVPSASASRSAATSSAVRSGGLTLKSGSYVVASSSVSSRWCGVTSAVTFQPFDFAQRRISTDPAVETWQTCSREPTCAASSTSRAMIASSATAGQPCRPSTPESSPSFICAPSVSRGSCACWATTPSNALTYSSARRISTASETQLPVVGEDPHPRRRVGHRAELGQPLARQPDGDGADRAHVAVPGLPAEPPDLLDHAGGVGDRVGVGHRVHGGEAAQRRGRRAGLDRLGVLPARLAQVGVQVDQPGQRDQAVGVDDLGAGPAQTGADLGDHAVLEQEVARRHRPAAGRP